MASTKVAVLGGRLHLRVAWLCGVVLCFEGYDIASVGYAIPSLVHAWHLHPSDFTLVLAAGNVGLMIGSVCAGLLGDRWGAKPVLIGCVIVFAAFSLLSGFAGSPSGLALLRFLAGLGLGGGLPLAVALASEFAPGKRKARLVILMATGVPIGFAIGGLLASWLVRVYGWPAIFVTGGALPLAITPVLARWLPQSATLGTSLYHRGLAAALFQNQLAPSTILLWAINGFSLVGVYFILLWTPAILHSTGASPSQAILATTMYALGVIASPLLTSLLVDDFGIERVLTCGLALGALCVLTIGLFYPSLPLLSLILCGAGIGGGCQGGILALSALAYPPTLRSTGAGWALGVGRVGTIAGPFLGGLLLSFGFRAQKLFLLASMPVFGASLLMAILGRVRQPPSQRTLR